MILWPLLTFTTFMTDIHTYIRTWRLYDRPSPEGQVCESYLDVTFNQASLKFALCGHSDPFSSLCQTAQVLGKSKRTTVH